MATESRAAELRGKSATELKDELVELRKEEFGLRMKRGTGQLADTSRFKKIRRDVARIKTILNEQAKSA
ncbi:MAG: 50S ribosomal protein L29 [Acidiferrobacterales bacterium]|nr:50S ribosomal protein L29 [Acidiferrobacterales bacterium]